MGSAPTSFQSICRGVGQNVSPLASSWVSSCESHIAKIDNRVGVKLDVVVVCPPVPCGTLVTSTSAVMFVQVRGFVVISVKGSGCRDRCE